MKTKDKYKKSLRSIVSDQMLTMGLWPQAGTGRPTLLLLGSSTCRLQNRGNEAKKYLKTNDITFFVAANCAHFARNFAQIERCMEQKPRVLRKTKLRLRSGQARKESDKKSSTWPADLAASLPTGTSRCGACMCKTAHDPSCTGFFSDVMLNRRRPALLYGTVFPPNEPCQDAQQQHQKRRDWEAVQDRTRESTASLDP